MKMNSLFEKTAALAIILAVCLGCKYLDFNSNSGIRNETKTQITKEILEERLLKKGVKIAEINLNEKPNPNLLVLKMVKGYAPPKLKLNGSEITFPELVTTLNSIFIDREKRGIFTEGTNQIYKRITLSASGDDITLFNQENVFVEDFEKLIDDLRGEKFEQIYLSFQTIPTLNLSDLKPSAPSNTATPPANLTVNPANTKTVPKMISGGVLNGKALNFVNPPYPAAAKAVRAAGAVNVQVMIDGQGNVISAAAVSGHPLLKPAAEASAKALKFSPTFLSGQPVTVSGVIVYNFKIPE